MNKYRCESVRLLEIPYWEYDNVDLILEEFIKKIA